LDAPDIEWSRTYGGTSDDGYHEVQLVNPSTGGYAVTGMTESFPRIDSLTLGIRPLRMDNEISKKHQQYQ